MRPSDSYGLAGSSTMPRPGGTVLCGRVAGPSGTTFYDSNAGLFLGGELIVSTWRNTARPLPNTQRLWAMDRSSAVAYSLALLLGLGVMLYVFPIHRIFATDTLIYPVRGDIAVHIIGQRYYVGDSWRWPLLVAKPLVTPDGTNIAFTDSIPLIAVPMKIFRAFLPPGFHSIFLWLALCWIVQPLAVVFALRSTGERRLLPSIAAAIFGDQCAHVHCPGGPFSSL